MKLSLDINQQIALRAAYQSLDGVGNGATRVPYKLGPSRRAVAKNITALMRTLEVFEKAQRSLLNEKFPNCPPGIDIRRDDDPPTFDAYTNEINEIMAVKEDVELDMIAATVLYAPGNEIGATALALLEYHNLVADDASPSAMAGTPPV
jgi:hypothetical protein